MPVKHTRALDSDALRAKLLTRCRERGISPRRMQQEAGLISGARIIAQLESGQSMMSDTFIRLLLWLGELDIEPYVLPEGWLTAYPRDRVPQEAPWRNGHLKESA